MAKREGTQDWRGLCLALPAMALLALFFAGPLLLLVRVSLYEPVRSGGAGFYQPGTWTLENYLRFGGEPYFRQVAAFTVLLGATVALLSVSIAWPLALYIARLPPTWRRIALAAVVLPKLANVLVIVYGIELLLSNQGPFNRLLLAAGAVDQPLQMVHNFPSVAIGKTWLIVPYAVLVLVAALDRIDPDLALAARGLGAGPLAAFWRVTLPLAAPGLWLAGALSLIWGLGAFVSPSLLGSPEQITLAVEVQRQAFENLNWPRSATAAVMMLFTLGVCAGMYRLGVAATRRRRR